MELAKEILLIEAAHLVPIRITDSVMKRVEVIVIERTGRLVDARAVRSTSVAWLCASCLSTILVRRISGRLVATCSG